MNDLTFGATLLSLFAAIVTTLAVEAVSVPAARPEVAAAGPAASKQRPLMAASTGCVTVARAPAPI